MDDFLELSDEQHRELGRLTAKFSDLEHAVKRIIGFFLDEDAWIGSMIVSCQHE